MGGVTIHHPEVHHVFTSLGNLTRYSGAVPSVQAVLLDVGGVLLLPDPDVMLRPLRRAGRDPTVEILDRSHYVAMAALDVAEVTMGGHLLGDHYRRLYVANCGVPPMLVQTVADDLGSTFGPASFRRPTPNVIQRLKDLAKAGARLGVVSNADGKIAQQLAEAGLCQVGEGAAVRLEVLIDSHLVGIEKPDPRIFGMAIEQLGLNPADVVYVGDSFHIDVVGARAAGIRPLHFDPYGDCRAGNQPLEHIRDLGDVVAMVRASAARQHPETTDGSSSHA
jgi:putative hydrolase of the HAD superfamily